MAASMGGPPGAAPAPGGAGAAAAAGGMPPAGMPPMGMPPGFDPSNLPADMMADMRKRMQDPEMLRTMKVGRRVFRLGFVALSNCVAGVGCRAGWAETRL